MRSGFRIFCPPQRTAENSGSSLRTKARDRDDRIEAYRLLIDIVPQWGTADRRGRVAPQQYSHKACERRNGRGPTQKLFSAFVCVQSAFVCVWLARARHVYQNPCTMLCSGVKASELRIACASNFYMVGRGSLLVYDKIADQRGLPHRFIKHRTYRANGAGRGLTRTGTRLRTSACSQRKSAFSP
jgi:hypothetical protein